MREGSVELVKLIRRLREVRNRVLVILCTILIALSRCFVGGVPGYFFFCQLVGGDLFVRLVIAVLHLADMRPRNELIKQCVILFICDFILHGHEGILKVHYCIVELK